MPSLLRSTTALAAAALGVLTSARAHACMWIDCEHADLRAGPANVPVLVHVADERQKTTIPTVVVRDDAGEEIPVTIAAEGHAPGVWLLRPSSPLAEGAQVTAEAPSCPSMAKQRTLSAQVGAAAAEPTAAGTITTSAPRDATLDDRGRLGCLSGEVVARAVDVTFTADPSLAPYLPITTIELRVDGEPYLDPAYGLPAVGALATTLVARCDAPGGLAPGPHDLEVRAWIPDREAPLTATARIDLSCAASATDETEAGGCAIGARHASGGGLVAAIGLCALVRRRRGGHARERWSPGRTRCGCGTAAATRA